MATKQQLTKQQPTKDKEIVKKPVTTVSASVDFSKDAGAGQESMGKEDYSVPRLIILQALSPQVTKGEDAFIKGAAAGNFCIAATGEVFDEEEGVKIIPVSYRRTYIEFKARSTGGGFVRDHGPGSDIINRCNRNEKTGANELPNGNIVNTVSEYFIFLLMPDGTHRPMMLSMTGAQLKHARKWNTAMNQLRISDGKGGSFNPAMFYGVYLAKTMPESNDQGNWFGWDIKQEGDVTTIPNGIEIYKQAKEFSSQVKAGAVKVQEPSADDPHSDDAALGNANPDGKF